MASIPLTYIGDDYTYNTHKKHITKNNHLIGFTFMTSEGDVEFHNGKPSQLQINRAFTVVNNPHDSINGKTKLKQRLQQKLKDKKNKSTP